MTPHEAAAIYGGETADWRELDCGAVAHRDAKIGERLKIKGPAVFLGGEFRGGVFWGGVFRGGVFWGGEFLGGVFWGGEFLGGEFLGGEFRGGVFWGGVFRGGVFWGGVFRGGVFWGGEFRGGEFRGGEFRGGEFRGGVSIFGILPWTINIAGPDLIAVGCEIHSVSHWRENFQKIADANGGLDDDQIDRGLQLLDFLEANESLWPKPEDKGNNAPRKDR